MNITLPSVIQSAIQLSEMKENESPALENIDPNLDKKFVICITKNLSEDELDLLHYFGKTISYQHDIINNVDLFTIDFEFFIIDLREHTDRMYLQRMILPNVNRIHFILYRYGFQTDMGISYENELTALPPKQVNAKIWKQLLLTKPIQAPNACLSFLGACVHVTSD